MTTTNPEVLPEFTGWARFDGRARATQWLDGRLYRLKPGRDFPADTPLKHIQSAVYGAAAKLGLTVHTRRERDSQGRSTGCLIVQVEPKESH